MLLQRFELSLELWRVLRICRPGACEIFDEGGPAATNPMKSRIDELLTQRLGIGVGLEMLNVGANADLDGGKRQPRVAAACGAEAAEVILPRLDITAETQVVGLMDHLAKGDVAVDAFCCGFVDVGACDPVETIDVNLRIRFGKKVDELMKLSPRARRNRKRAIRIVVGDRTKPGLRTLARHDGQSDHH